jgi:serine/threonine protein kinase
MEENRLYIQTEMCTTTLAAEMKQAELTEQRKYKYLREICVALEFIHKNGMVHLDIKPENIFVSPFKFQSCDRPRGNSTNDLSSCVIDKK